MGYVEFVEDLITQASKRVDLCFSCVAVGVLVAVAAALQVVPALAKMTREICAALGGTIGLGQSMV